MSTSPEIHPSTEPPRDSPPIKRPRPKSSARALDWRTLDLAQIDGAPPLAQELATYQAHLAELLKHKGEFVLIKGPEVIAIYATLEAALDASAERFGAEPALIKRITSREPIQFLGGLAP